MIYEIIKSLNNLDENHKHVKVLTRDLICTKKYFSHCRYNGKGASYLYWKS